MEGGGGVMVGAVCTVSALVSQGKCGYLMVVAALTDSAQEFAEVFGAAHWTGSLLDTKVITDAINLIVDAFFSPEAGHQAHREVLLTAGAVQLQDLSAAGKTP